MGTHILPVVVVMQVNHLYGYWDKLMIYNEQRHLADQVE